MQRALLVFAALVAALALAFLRFTPSAATPVGSAQRTAPTGPRQDTADAGALDGAHPSSVQLLPTAEAERSAQGGSEDPAGRQRAVAPEGPFRLHVEVRSKSTGAPLGGWAVLLTEVGAGVPATRDGDAPEHVLGPDGRYVFEDLSGTGPWNVHVQPALPQRMGQWSGAAPRRLGAALATNETSPAPVLFEARTGPLVVLSATLPPGTRASDVEVELTANDSPLSSQIGGLGGSAQAFTLPEGSTAAHAPPITNGSRADGGRVLAWTRDGSWKLTAEIPARIENDARIEVDAPWTASARARFVLVPPDPEAVKRLAAWPGAHVRQGEPTPSSRQVLRARVLEDGIVEILGLNPGPLWLAEVDLPDGRKIPAATAQASIDPGEAVELRIVPAPR